MLFLMVISLYTSRILLHALGVEDFGINNVIGGFVVMFAFVNRSMSSVTQRFLTYELGRKDNDKLNKVFNATLFIHIAMGLLVILFAETFGLWFLHNKMVIPQERFTAALWVFHTSVLITAIGVSYIPFNAIIISHERMNVFAWISILEGIIKIFIAYCISMSRGDRLVFYSILMLVSQVIVVAFYVIYSKKNFNETRLSLQFNRPIFKDIFGFFGWNFYGTMGSVIVNQGVNVLLNMFFGVVVNAARGIAVQVESAVLAFADNIQTAINPQITKTYAQNEYAKMHSLILFNCKVTFFVMFVLSLPIWIETDTILKLWLDIFPDYAVSFLRLLLIAILIDVLGKPFVISINSTGSVKMLYKLTGSLLLFEFPLCYLAILLTNNPNSVFICMIILNLIIFLIRVLLTKPLIYLNLKRTFSVFLRLGLVAILCCAIISVISIFFESHLAILMISIFLNIFITSLLMYFIVLSNTERETIKSFVKSKLLLKSNICEKK